MTRLMRWRLHLLMVVVFCGVSASAAELPAAAHFRANVQSLLTEYCADCHADGANKGGVAFDAFTSDEAIVTNRALWLTALKNLRAGLMPPEKKARPAPDEIKRIENWIKYDDFGLDPKNPDPGRVTLRRLNRVEYRNTIRDLMGVVYDTSEEFPADDTGYGFDNIADVLTLSPMLLEKYLDAARTIVTNAVPTVSRTVVERTIPGATFMPVGGASSNAAYLSYYTPAAISKTIHLRNAGSYELRVDLMANETYADEEFDSNRCRLVFKVDGQELLRHDFIREVEKVFHFQINHDLASGEHQLAFEVEPLTKEKQVRSLHLWIDSVIVRGPMEEKFQVTPTNYTRFFPREVPPSASARRAYARELLGAFATRAFRHPADNATVNRLASLAENFYKQRGKTFEAGIAHAMTAVLASPQFLFREENLEPNHPAGTQPLVDEYALASRLSYFLWSSMPDDELFRLAAAHQLRQNLPAQVTRLLADKRSQAFIKNFTGQWLQGRDIETVAIDARAVLELEAKSNPETELLRARLRELHKKPKNEITQADSNEAFTIHEKLAALPLRAKLGSELRLSMRREEELYFEHIVRDDRSVLELIESDYTFLNEHLARHYGLTNLDLGGPGLFLVTLPPDSARGGVLTMGGVLAVTSNPTRTSPVKRGLFILDNILGMPVPPPPPNIPLLEDSDHEIAGRKPTLREVLAVHREKPMCNSCHSRMDPLGLALENFNAMGMWRARERDQAIEPAGKLITGEPFQNVRELKHILATRHRLDFYRTLTGKLLTYALGRGLEYYDVETVDQIVDRLDRENGHFSALLSGIIESAPFQKRRESGNMSAAEKTRQVEQRAERK